MGRPRSSQVPQDGQWLVGLAFLWGLGLYVAGLLGASSFSSHERLLRFGLPYYWLTKSSVLSAMATSEWAFVLSMVDHMAVVLALAQWPIYAWLVITDRVSWARGALWIALLVHVLIGVTSTR